MSSRVQLIKRRRRSWAVLARRLGRGHPHRPDGRQGPLRGEACVWVHARVPAYGARSAELVSVPPHLRPDKAAACAQRLNLLSSQLVCSP